MNFKSILIFLVLSIYVSCLFAQNIIQKMKEPISISFKDTDIVEALRIISDRTKVVIFPGTDISGKVTMQFANTPLETVLKTLVESTGSTFTIVNDTIYVTGIVKKEEKQVVERAMEEKQTFKEPRKCSATERLVPLKYLKAPDILSLLPPYIPQANIKILEDQNAVFVTGTEEMVAKFIDFISMIDNPSPQVSMEMLVVEFMRTAGEDFSFGATYKQEHAVINAQPSSTELSIKSVDWLPKEFSLTLRAAISKGKAKIRANPRVVTLNGKEAVIKIGTGGFYKDGAVYPWKITMFDYGIILRAKPWITDSGEIIMELHPEVNTVTGRTSDNLPEMNRRTVDTTVRVKDGQTITIGGLLQEDESTTSKKVPILGDLPIIGYLFKTRTFSQTQKELVIYITPHILTSARE